MFSFFPLVFLIVFCNAESCLTPIQESQLKESMNLFDNSLKATVAGLEVATHFVNNPEQKHKLKTASHDIQVIDELFVKNVTQIIDSVSCGKCSDVTFALDVLVKQLEKTLTNIEPEWNSEKLFKDIFKALNVVLNVVHDACPSAKQLAVYTPTGCLTPQQKTQLEQATTGISSALTVASSGLSIAAIVVTDPKLKSQLTQAAGIITIINDQVVSKLGHIADETCGTCSEITKAVQDMVKSLSSALSKIMPQWKTNPYFEAITDALKTILTLVTNICPNKNNSEFEKAVSFEVSQCGKCKAFMHKLQNKKAVACSKKANLRRSCSMITKILKKQIVECQKKCNQM